MKAHDNFSYAFEKILYGITSSEKRDADFANGTALKIFSRKYAEFRQVLSDAGELGDHECDLDTFAHGIDVLQGYFDGTTGGLTERLPV
ncbi:MAG TPA: hypothetical protein DEF80_06420 [Pantoea sp.]|nr:hypothetical protein [Pantoea sp.]